VTTEARPQSSAFLTASVREAALRLGFDDVGISPVQPSEHGEFFRSWLAAGRHGSMSWLARPDAVERRLDAGDQVRSAIVVTLNYYTPEDVPAPGHGIIARYARGRDYHKVIKARLLKLLAWLEGEVGHSLPLARASVDTAPVFERELARRAGLGWFGRNTMLINPRSGSYFFLATLLVEIDLDADTPFAQDHCGTCSACVTSCPTGALLGRDERGAPVIDATRCISYLTIENRGPIPRELRPLIGNRVFGCDICQEVCPWNSPKFVAITRERDFVSRGDAEARSLAGFMTMNDDDWDVFSRGSPIRRARRAGFLRNVAVALGNTRSVDAVPALACALDDDEPLVRGHAAWALGRIGTERSREALVVRLTRELDEFVEAEIRDALSFALHDVAHEMTAGGALQP